MLYATICQGRVVSIEDKPRAGDPTQECRWDWHSLERAEEIAAGARELTGKLYLAVDSGPGVSPRFDIVRAPEVGDEVSYAFNGDSYPCGRVAKVTPKTARIVTTDSGKVFYRRRQTASWVMQGGTWHLVPGHVRALNPEF